MSTFRELIQEVGHPEVRAVLENLNARLREIEPQPEEDEVADAEASDDTSDEG